MLPSSTQHGHLSHRVDEKKSLPSGNVCRVGLRVARGGAGLVQGDARGERAGEGCEVEPMTTPEVIEASCGGCVYVLDGIILGAVGVAACQVFLYNMVHKKTVHLRRAARPAAGLRCGHCSAHAMGAFWQFGYSATSLDQLSDATDMNRPSLYAAFGDKRALYLQTLDSYTERSKAGIAQALDPQLSLAEGLQRFYDYALASYQPSGDPARGCYLIGTAVTEALGDAEVRTRLGSALREFERMVAARIQQARNDGEIDATADPQAL
jgi:hypothetical protein